VNSAKFFFFVSALFFHISLATDLALQRILTLSPCSPFKFNKCFRETLLPASRWCLALKMDAVFLRNVGSFTRLCLRIYISTHLAYIFLQIIYVKTQTVITWYLKDTVQILKLHTIGCSERRLTGHRLTRVIKKRTEHNRSFYNTWWRNTDWITDQVITEWVTFSFPGDTTMPADKMFWTSNKSAQWKIYTCGRMKSTNVNTGNATETLRLKKKKLRGFSPQANCTDRAIAAGQRS
jgi:hypothetical protein